MTTARHTHTPDDHVFRYQTTAGNTRYLVAEHDDDTGTYYVRPRPDLAGVIDAREVFTSNPREAARYGYAYATREEAIARARQEYGFAQIEAFVARQSRQFTTIRDVTAWLHDADPRFDALAEDELCEIVLTQRANRFDDLTELELDAMLAAAYAACGIDPA